MSQCLPLETQTLYAEVLEHLLGVQATRSIGLLPGTFTAPSAGHKNAMESWRIPAIFRTQSIRAWTSATPMCRPIFPGPC